MLAGCGRNDVQVYRVSKDEPKAASPDQSAGAMPAGHPDMGTGEAAPPGIKYSLPAGWQEAPPGQMRVASFRINGNDGKQAEVAVVPLPGLMGRDLENVNRWRSSVGLGPVREEDLPKMVQPVVVAGQPGQLYEQAGENPGSGEKTRILAAISRQNNIAWFFKMTGDDGLVAQQKPAFIDFLKSVSFAAAPADASAGLPPAHPPIGEGAMPLMSAAGASSDTASAGGGKPTWQVPAGWQEAAAGQFLVAKFMISGGNGQAAVNVSMSGGDGGGLAGNINRWRGQLGLSPLADDQLGAASLDTSAGKASLVDLSGHDARTGQDARLLGVIAPQGGRTWFYKLMGNAQVVESQKDAFLKFVQSAKY